jgi:peptide deformylase
MPLPIVCYNDPILRKKGAPVADFDDALRSLGEQMIATMHEARGIGLAAQQIGRALQLCVVDLRDSEAEFSWRLDGASPPLELIMPMRPRQPLPRGGARDGGNSIRGGLPVVSRDPGRGRPARRRQGQVSGRLRSPHTLECDGLLARCIQHEADHLNGVLFIDRMSKKTRAGIDEAIKALAKHARAAAPKAAATPPAPAKA